MYINALKYIWFLLYFLSNRLESVKQLKYKISPMSVNAKPSTLHSNLFALYMCLHISARGSRLQRWAHFNGFVHLDRNPFA